jgi:hypothetical protein
MEPLKRPCAVRSGPCCTKPNGRRLCSMDERTKCEPLCQFCVSWHTLSWSVLVDIAEMAETDDRTKFPICAGFTGLLRENGWCCQTGLNCRPLHYQWSALPLSYGSIAPDMRIGPKGPQGGPILATRPPFAQAREAPVKHQKRSGQPGRGGLSELDQFRTDRVPVSSPSACSALPWVALIGLLFRRCGFEEWSERVCDDG